MLRQGALLEAATALGRRWMQPGFGATEEDDVFYALGWPHFVHLVPGDAKPALLDDPAKFSSTHLFKAGPVAAGVAPRMLRHLYALRHDPKNWAAAIANAAPLDDEGEIEKLLDFVVREQFGFVSSLLLEAITSTRRMLDALTKRIEVIPDGAWSLGSFEAFGGNVLRALHYLLLRSDEEHAKAIRDRLEAVHAKAFAVAKDTRPEKALDLTLHGRAGVERLGDDYSLGFALDKGFIRERARSYIPKMKARDRSGFDARLVFLGGEDLLEDLATNIKGLHKDAREPLVIGLSRMKPSPVLREIMKALGTRTAKAWLKAH